MTPLRNAAFATALLGLMAGPASAQTTPPGTSTPATNLDSKPGTLSDKLSETNGVIKPTGNVDPEMHKATPQAGTMPVIKPGAVTPATPK